MSDIVEPQIVTKSWSGSGPTQQRGLPFGDPEPRLAALETLARDARGYDARIAYLMSVISAWAYADETVLGLKLRYYGLEGAHIRRVTVQNNALLVVTTAYLIQSRSGSVGVLAFRGTDPGNFVTVLTDTQVMQRSFLNHRVHSGFHLSVEVVWDEINESIKAARDGHHIAAGGAKQSLGTPMQHLYLTGHSLGGAMALLAAARLSRDDYKRENIAGLIRGVYTFGQPMVGDKAFAQHCDQEFGERLFRHVYNHDVVPQLPPRSELDYAHSAGEFRADRIDSPWIHRKKQTSRLGLIPALVHVAVNAVKARTMASDGTQGASIDDHNPIRYVEVSSFSLRKDKSKAVLTAESKRHESATTLLGKLTTVVESTYTWLRSRFEPSPQPPDAPSSDSKPQRTTN